jgi:hypothetical protein
VQYSLWYVAPITLPVGDLVTEELMGRIVASSWLSSLPSLLMMHVQTNIKFQGSFGLCVVP